jgi:hypothetical protein
MIAAVENAADKVAEALGWKWVMGTRWSERINCSPRAVTSRCASPDILDQLFHPLLVLFF